MCADLTSCRLLWRLCFHPTCFHLKALIETNAIDYDCEADEAMNTLTADVTAAADDD